MAQQEASTPRQLLPNQAHVATLPLEVDEQGHQGKHDREH